MHTSHAAKFGSRAGLGMTLIQLGFYSRTLGNRDEDDGAGGQGTSWQNTPIDSSVEVPVPDDTTQSPLVSDVAMKDWLSFLLMTMGM